MKKGSQMGTFCYLKMYADPGLTPMIPISNHHNHKYYHYYSKNLYEINNTF